MIDENPIAMQQIGFFLHKVQFLYNNALLLYIYMSYFYYYSSALDFSV